MRSCARILGFLVLALVVGSSARAQQKAGPGSENILARGEYLARAGDCIACPGSRGPHLRRGKSSADAVQLYSSNITPDRETGIGKWRAEDFYKAMHKRSLSATAVYVSSDAVCILHRSGSPDSQAIFAYLKSIPPVNIERIGSTTSAFPTTTAN